MNDNKALRGTAWLKNKSLNKSTAFTKEEREALGLRGLLPYAKSDQQMQVNRVMANLNRKASDIEKYILLNALQDRNERLFYRLLQDRIEEVLPLVYTPTVGQACREFSHIFRQSKGLYITPEDRGDIRKLLQNWPEEDVRVVVVTDGERILGLGDLGANGMGIPIGKLALYTACAGIPPQQCLPIMLDVGTNNEEIRTDPLYLGYPYPRIQGEAYFELVDEMITALNEKYPNILIQFEDFLTPKAYALLEKYRHQVLCFNDDIQGTAAVALAGVYSSNRITGHKFADLNIMFLGAGSAATGIADLMVSAFVDAGLSTEEAYKRLHFVDIDGLLVSGRPHLEPHNRPYAKDRPAMSFIEAIETVKPQILIGATGAPGTFNRDVISLMSRINERPVIFALSNPTHKAECTAEQAYKWSGGKAVFASGSPFKPVTFGAKTYYTGQGNNVYIFPGVGLGAMTAQPAEITDKMFLEAAKTLAESVRKEDISKGVLYPPLTSIRDVSTEIAIAVAEEAYSSGLARADRPSDLIAVITALQYDPAY
jgi:malate dehydrogenase (oxaloacetate-decarboxylating)(NADP+)